jgi:hypothetical protein
MSAMPPSPFISSATAETLPATPLRQEGVAVEPILAATRDARALALSSQADLANGFAPKEMPVTPGPPEASYAPNEAALWAAMHPDDLPAFIASPSAEFRAAEIEPLLRTLFQRSAAA